MGFGEAIGSVLGKYATFSGRARRSEFWWWWLALLGLNLIMAALAWFFGSGTSGTILKWTWTAVVLALFVPSVAVAIRRLHDTGRAGWWWLLGLVPLLQIVLIVLYALPSTPGENTYGPQPA